MPLGERQFFTFCNVRRQDIPTPSALLAGHATTTLSFVSATLRLLGAEARCGASNARTFSVTKPYCAVTRINDNSAEANTGSLNVSHPLLDFSVTRRRVRSPRSIATWPDRSS